MTLRDIAMIMCGVSIGGWAVLIYFFIKAINEAKKW